MSLPQDNDGVYEAEVVYEASLVEHESTKRKGPSTGCIIGGVLGGLLTLLVLVGVVGWVVFIAPDMIGPVDPVDPNLDVSEATEFVQGVNSDADSNADSNAGANGSLANLGGASGIDDVKQHPDFSKIDNFVGMLAACLDDTPNKKVRKLIDYRQYWQELCKRSKTFFHSEYFIAQYLSDLNEVLTGPASIVNQDYQILRIEKTTLGYRVALAYDKGYGHHELQVWWLTDDSNVLRIYDWFDAEAGMRGSREHAILCDATPTQLKGNDAHSSDSDAYFAIDDNLEFHEYQRQIKACLKRCETYRGPSKLKSAMHLIVAKRWAHHDESVEAMRMLGRIAGPTKTPGVFLLRGDIFFQNGLYEEAQKEYQQFVSASARYPYIEQKLIECARELGDFAEEKQLLTECCAPISIDSASNLPALVELNSEVENEELFRKIDRLDEKEQIYRRIISVLKYAAPQNQELKQVQTHLQATLPDSFLVRVAGMNANSTDETLIELLQWVEGQTGEEASQYAYEFWSEVPEDRIPAILATSENKEKQFSTISEYYDYEEYFPENAEEICELVLKENPKSPEVNTWLASHLLERDKYESAIEKLKIVTTSLGAEDEDTTGARYLMLSALHGAGDSEAALKWAREHELATSLLSLKFNGEKYDDAEQLIELLEEGSNDRRYYMALLKSSRGETEAAIKDLVTLDTEANEQSQPNYRYSYKIGQIFAKADQPAKLLKLFPDETRFWEAANMLINNRKWEDCRQLLGVKEATLKDSQRCLRLLLEWEQGNYAALAALEINSDKIPKVHSNLERIHDYLVRSCIHEGEFEKAKQWAQKYTDSNKKIIALAGVAIKQAKWTEAAKRLRQMGAFSRTDVVNDSHLWEPDAFVQPEIASLIPPKMEYAIDRLNGIELAFLFETDVPFKDLEFGELLQETMSDNVTETQWASSPSGAMWKSLSNERFDVVVKVTNPKYIYPADDHLDDESKQIHQLFPKGQARVDLRVYPTGPLSSMESMKLVDAFAKPICNLKPILLGSGYHWLPAEKFDSWFAAKSKREGTLYVSETCRGIWCYPRTKPANKEKDQPELTNFQANLASVLKRFAGSNDPTKKLVVQTTDAFGFQEFEVNVGRVKRSSWGGMIIIGKPEPLENVPEATIPRTDISLSATSIVGFEASFDGETIDETDRGISTEQ